MSNKQTLIHSKNRPGKWKLKDIGFVHPHNMTVWSELQDINDLSLSLCRPVTFPVCPVSHCYGWWTVVFPEASSRPQINMVASSPAEQTLVLFSWMSDLIDPACYWKTYKHWRSLIPNKRSSPALFPLTRWKVSSSKSIAVTACLLPSSFADQNPVL